MTYSHPAQIPRSRVYSELRWLSERIPVSDPRHRGDTYPITWADDDNLYMGTGDPSWYLSDEASLHCSPASSPEYRDYVSRRVCGCCFEQLTGNPDCFDVERINDMPGFYGWGGQGPKPSGMISVDGVLYYAVQNLLGTKPARFREKCQHGSDATILRSDDHGKTWTPDLNEILDKYFRSHYTITDIPEIIEWKEPAELRNNACGWVPMFPGNVFGGPSFVQFGKNSCNAIDNYVYAISGDQWDNGTEMRLGRVPKDKIQDRSAWSFAIPKEDGSASWTYELNESLPVLAIDGHLGLPEMVYLPNERKYLTLTWGLHTDFHASDGSELTILESDNPWGPFRLVHYQWMWSNEMNGSYCPRIPLKWFDEKNLTGYLLYSGNWEFTEPVLYYMPQLMKFSLTRK